MANCYNGSLHCMCCGYEATVLLEYLLTTLYYYVQEVAVCRCLAFHPSGDYMLVGTDHQTCKYVANTKCIVCVCVYARIYIGMHACLYFHVCICLLIYCTMCSVNTMNGFQGSKVV